MKVYFWGCNTQEQGVASSSQQNSPSLLRSHINVDHPKNRLKVAECTQVIDAGRTSTAITVNGQLHIYGELLNADIWSDLSASNVSTSDSQSSKDSHGISVEEKRDDCCICVSPLMNMLPRGCQVRFLSCGSAHALLSTENQTFGWGWNKHGQLGLGHTNTVRTPTTISTFENQHVLNLSCAEVHSTVLVQDGGENSVYVFGKASSGLGAIQVSNHEEHPLRQKDEVKDSSSNNCFPQRIPKNAFIGSVTRIACSWCHNMALTSLGCIYTWGIGLYGALGHGSLETVHFPKRVEILDGIRIVDIDCGIWHSVALSDAGGIYTWGFNKHCQLGLSNEKVASQFLPELLDLPDQVDIVKTRCGARHTLALTSKGLVYSWGWNLFGQVSENKNENMLVEFEDPVVETPKIIETLLEITDIAAGHWCSVAVKKS